LYAPTAELVDSPVVMLPRVDLSGADADIELVVLTDIHWGASDHLARLWARDKAYVLARDPATTRVLLLGDVTQMDTKFQRHSGVYQQALSPEQQVDKAVEELAPLSPYIDLFLAGNHDARVTEAVGLDACKFIAMQLGVKGRYVRDNAVVSYSVGRASGSHASGGGPRPLVYTVYAYHGEGTGASDSSILRAVNKVPNIDLYVSGHIHTRKVLYPSYQLVDPRTNTIKFRRRVAAVCPSYQGGAGWTTRRNFADSDWGMSRFTLKTGHKFVRAEDGLG
jgi:hypothetical protein